MAAANMQHRTTVYAMVRYNKKTNRNPTEKNLNEFREKFTFA